MLMLKIEIFFDTVLEKLSTVVDTVTQFFMFG